MENTLPEYVALYKSDATVSGNIYTWNLDQQSYFTNSRGNVCYVSLVECIISAPDSNEIIVKYHGSQNQFTTDRQPAVIGLLSMTAPHQQNAGHLQLSSSETIKLLVNSRPKKIVLQTNNLDNTSYVPDEAVFILKFEYLNIKKQNENLLEQQYLKL